MQLKIYLISHPIIKILSNSISFSGNTKNNTNNLNVDTNLSKFLIYEVMRNSINLQTIYVKKLSYVKKIYILNKNTDYYLVTNLIHNYTIIEELKKVLPKINIIHVDNKNENKTRLITSMNLEKYIKYKKIIIFDNFLNENLITKIIENLHINNRISTYSINVACIVCYDQILEKLGKKYPNINIYTTQIIS